jgi:hypothetical protein
MSVNGDESNEEEAVASLLGGEHKSDMPERGSRVTHVAFGVELTNSPRKRGSGVTAYGDGGVARLSPSKLGRG